MLQKRLWHKCFPVNLVEFLKTLFLQNTSGRQLLLLAFQKQPPEMFLAKFGKIDRKKHLWFEKFSRTSFLQNSSGRLLLAFPCNFTNWGTGNSIQKTSDEYYVSGNTNLRSTVKIHNFFLGSINFQCMFSLVNTVYCQKWPPEQRCSVKKGFLKIFVKFKGKQLCCLESLFNKFAAPAPIFTARKTIFSFSRRPEKMVFPKKTNWNMIFLVLSGNMILLFPKI